MGVVDRRPDVIVRILLVPLTVRQIHSMQNLQAHAPEMKAIQQRYKHDRQQMNAELMKFYRENKINPAASCLPILAQFPVFIGALLRPEGLREGDRVQPSSRATASTGSDLVNIAENTKEAWGPLLIVIYAAQPAASSYFMSPTMQKAQRCMLLVLPIAFILFVLNFPAGLMLYWLTTNLWTTGQGLVTRRLVPKKPNRRPRRARGRRRRRTRRRTARNRSRSRPPPRRRHACAR